MKKAIALLLLLLFSLNNYATSIIILRRPDGFYVAADSKRVRRDNRGHTGWQRVCKIHYLSNVYLAIAGHDDDRLLKNAAIILRTGGNLDARIARYAAMMTQYYNDLMQKEKQSDPQAYAYYTKNNLAQVAFFGYDGPNAFLKNIDFIPQVAGGRLRVNSYIQDIPVNKLLFLGESTHSNKPEAIRSAMSANPGTPLYGLRALIRTEMSYDPAHIGEPIDLVLLRPDGPTWFSPAQDLTRATYPDLK